MAAPTKNREPTIDREPTDLVHAELRATFEAQVERLREIDNKAIEILKANLLVIGVFATGISILVQTEIEVAAFVNPFTAVAGALLLCSTALAGITYTSSNLRGGLDAGAVEAIRDGAFSEEEIADALARSYGRWIAYNAEVTAVNDVLITITVLLVVDALIYLVAGIVVATLAAPAVASVLAFVALTAVLAWTTRLVYHMDHIDSPGVERPPFDGVRLSKGGSRPEGHSALRRMLRSPPETEPQRDEHAKRGPGLDPDRRGPCGGSDPE